MSTIFEVYPAHLRLPSFEDVLNVAEKRIGERLVTIGIEAKVRLRVTLRTQRGKEELARAAKGAFQWEPGKETYAWVEVVGCDGGCDVTYSEDREAIEVFRDEIKYTKTLPDEFVDRCLDLGRRWAFRRSAGQPCTIAFVYGYVAAAFAELTDGFIYSDDGAWDRDMLPMRASEFYATYFRPEKTQTRGKWVADCLEELPLELGP